MVSDDELTPEQRAVRERAQATLDRLNNSDLMADHEERARANRLDRIMNPEKEAPPMKYRIQESALQPPKPKYITNKTLDSLVDAVAFQLSKRDATISKLEARIAELESKSPPQKADKPRLRVVAGRRRVA